MNILDYVKNTTRTFEEMPLNPVESRRTCRIACGGA